MKLDLAYISNSDGASRWVFAPQGLRKGDAGYMHVSLLGGRFDEEQALDGTGIATREHTTEVGTVLRPVGCSVSVEGTAVAVVDDAGKQRNGQDGQPLWNLKDDFVVQVRTYRASSTGVKRVSVATPTAVPQTAPAPRV